MNTTNCLLQCMGKWHATINYHMALHIPDVIADYGPTHGYWCIAYERMNGMIADIPNSKHDIELQIINKLVQQFSCMAFRIDKVSEAEIYIPKALQVNLKL